MCNHVQSSQNNHQSSNVISKSDGFGSHDVSAQIVVMSRDVGPPGGIIMGKSPFFQDSEGNHNIYIVWIKTRIYIISLLGSQI